MRRLSLLLPAVGLLFATLSPAADEPLLPRGTRELGLNGTVFVSHDSPEDLFGVAAARGGYYLAKNQQVGADATVFAYSRIQDLYLSGFYRYIFAGTDRHLAPYAGVAVGANVAQFSQVGSERSLIAKGQAGVRCFMGRKFSLDIGYDLMYRRHREIGFTGRTTSILTFGFSRLF